MTYEKIQQLREEKTSKKTGEKHKRETIKKTVGRTNQKRIHEKKIN